MEIVAVDIGGTHARFAIAEIADGRVAKLGEPVTLRTADHASLQAAWEAFAEQSGRPLPRAAGIAFAGPVGGDILQLTNSHWAIRPALIREQLPIDRFVLVNDFGAVGHAVAQAGPNDFQHLAGPDIALPATGVISIVGPGTGLGVAHVLRHAGGYHVTETEGGHGDFAPLDAFEDTLLAHLRTCHARVSVERVVSGPGLREIHAILGGCGNDADTALWAAALDGSDDLAAAALDRFCLSLGSVAGDIALVQGARGVVITGGLGRRLAAHLPRSGFAERFAAKGRFEPMMRGIPVKSITHPQPGLLGAAAAFAKEHAA